MKKWIPLLAVPVLAIALAVSAVAFVPGMLNALSPASANQTTVTAPSWKVGDRWTYNLSFGSLEARQILPQEMLVHSGPIGFLPNGTLTEAVVSSVPTYYAPAWNVTVEAAFARGEPGPITTYQPVVQPFSLDAITVSGFVWYRASDLAPIYSVKTVRMGATWIVMEPMAISVPYRAAHNATVVLSYQATTEIWYRPALALWQFPLQENTSWNVSSNATVRYWSSFGVKGPNVTFGSVHHANFTLPIRFTMRSGGFETVTTPAGAFRALEVTAYRGRVLPAVSDHDASATMNLTEAPELVSPRAFASAWFSAQVGNVVKAEFWDGGEFGPRLEMNLVSYTYG